MVFVSITRLRLRSWRYVPLFFLQALRSGLQAKAAAGSLGVTTLREPGGVFWTRTLWDAESSMKAFMLSGAHRGVMHSLLEWCDEAAVAHWTQDSPEAPTWSAAREQLLRIGRPSKVNHPSEAQRQFQIAEPRITPGGETRWK